MNKLETCIICNDLISWHNSADIQRCHREFVRVAILNDDQLNNNQLNNNQLDNNQLNNNQCCDNKLRTSIIRR